LLIRGRVDGRNSKAVVSNFFQLFLSRSRLSRIARHPVKMREDRCQYTFDQRYPVSQDHRGCVSVSSCLVNDLVLML